MHDLPEQRYGVIGGGLLGMTLAYRLAQYGQKVTLYEAADHLGGLASAWRLGDVTWDRHYHVTLLSDSHIRKILKEIGLDDEIRWVETKTGFYTDGQLHSMSNTLEFLRFPPLGLIDKLRLGGTIFHASRVKDWKRLEQIPVANWLRKLSGPRTFEKIWLPLLRAKLGENYKTTSAAFIWATIARMYAARRTGLKKEMFGYVPGGYARILGRFHDRLQELGVDIRLGHRVEKIESLSDQQIGVRFHSGATAEFDQLALTMPAPIVPRVCPGLRDDERRLFQGIEYQGIVCASLLTRKPLDRYYVTNITDPGIPFTAVIEMSALVDRAEFGGNSLVYIPKYVPSEDPWLTEPDDVVKERFLSGLERMYPHFQRSDVLAFRISRVQNVMPLPTLGYSQRLPPLETSIPGVYAVNSAHIVNGTLNVNETVRLAEDALTKILLPGILNRQESLNNATSSCQPFTGSRQ